ncbi:MAG: sterol desaturase family protein [Pseudomonadota bacterium]
MSLASLLETALEQRVDVTPEDSSNLTFARQLINLLPPVTVVSIVLFWSLAPDAWVENPVTLLLIGLATSAFIQGLEFVFERHPEWRLNLREFATDLFYLILSYTAISWATFALVDAPLMQMKEAIGLTTLWLTELPIAVQAFLVLFIIEFGQYWMHRLMHNWHPLWLTHAPHHHLTQLNAMKGYVGNPLELFLITVSVVGLFDFDLAAIFCAITVLGAIAGFAHANVRSDPPPLYSFMFTTIRHHSLHHSVGYEETRCNYANTMIFIDRIFGTFREGEASCVGQDERRRLSILEQFMFPITPLINWMTGSRKKA